MTAQFVSFRNLPLEERFARWLQRAMRPYYRLINMVVFR